MGDATSDTPMTALTPNAKGEKRELLCEVCDREYRVWFAPNPLWNAVIRRDENDEDDWHFLCPTCFTNIAAERGVESMAFEIRRAADNNMADIAAHYYKALWEIAQSDGTPGRHKRAIARKAIGWTRELQTAQKKKTRG